MDTTVVQMNSDLEQVVLGHRSTRTTARYTRVSTELIARTRSPLDRLPNLV
jgi:hypothetical protein